MLHSVGSILFASLSILAVLSTRAHAEEINASPEPGQKDRSGPQQPEEKDWNFSLGGGVMFGPKYEGSDNYRFMPLPDVSVEYKNGLFFANMWEGIGSYPLQGKNYKVGASIGYSFGRKESDDKDNLRGMGDIGFGVTANLMGEYGFGPLQISGQVTTGTADYGITATMELGTMFPVTERLMVMLSAGSTWADEKHMQTYFGVSSAQSERSGYRRYDAGSGFKSVGFTVGAFYFLTEHWDIKLMVKGDQLVGNAANSPITKEAFNPAVFLSTGYNF